MNTRELSLHSGEFPGPVLRLPPELLLLVFFFLCGYSEQAVRISWVCSRWRQTALGCQNLWTSHMYCTVANSNRGTSPRLIRMMLERSGALLLRVRITNFLRPSTPELTIMSAFQKLDEVVETFIEEAHRWVSLTVDLRNDWFAATLLDRLKSTRFPALRCLHVSAAPSLHAQLHGEPWNGGTSLPFEDGMPLLARLGFWRWDESLETFRPEDKRRKSRRFRM